MPWETGDPIYDTVLVAAFLFVVAAAAGSIFVPAPYGRFTSRKGGFSLNPRLGWFLMELPATLSFLFFFFRGPNWRQPVPFLFCLIWLLHYSNRGFLFPYLMRVPKGTRSGFGLLVVASGWVVTTVHGYLNGAYFSTFGKYSVDWVTDPRFLVGFSIYAVSLVLNVHSDAIIRNLRSEEEVAQRKKVYRIPRGGLFRWVTSPQYLTELTAWAGFAIFTWSPGGLFILGVSMANLIPRALVTHRWYHKRFENYPKERKALVPFLF